MNIHDRKLEIDLIAILGREVYQAMVGARFGISRILNAAALEAFEKGREKELPLTCERIRIALRELNR